MDLKPGSRWKSTVFTAEMVVVRPPRTSGELQCGGVAVAEHSSTETPSGEPRPDHAG